MAKLRVHLRVAKTGGRYGHRVQANINPSSAPLYDNNNNALPTIAFAIVLEIDPAAFKAAEKVIAELQIGPSDVEVAAELGP